MHFATYAVRVLTGAGFHVTTPPDASVVITRQRCRA